MRVNLSLFFTRGLRPRNFLIINMSSKSMNWAEVRKRLSKYNQQHLIKWVGELTKEEQELLYGDLLELDLAKVQRCYKEAKMTLSDSNEMKDERLKPLDDCICGSTARNKKHVDEWRRRGLEKISRGEVGVLLLAGGQGTRLGVSYPKGMYDVGLPSSKTLYQIQAERIMKLQSLAKAEFGNDCTVPWYIMTSEYTKNRTLQFFKSHKYFGLNSKNVIVFEQNTFPCLDYEGKIILDQKNRIARAPDGNGGLYTALLNSDYNVLKDMRRRGILCIHVYCVDNILVKMADPVFIGFCDEREADCGAKVVRKSSPTEKVGVVCVLDEKYQVVEYSEISMEIAEKRNSDGTLLFSAGNICNHYFTIDFLEEVCNKHESQLIHHVAKKKVHYIDESGSRIEPPAPNGIKMEKFVFDVFQFSKNFAVLEVLREDEFSPLKNAPGAAKDTPATCRASLMDLHYRQLLAAGGVVVDENGSPLPLIPRDTNGTSSRVECEISPLLSYFGEGLTKLCKGKKFTQPIILETNGPSAKS